MKRDDPNRIMPYVPFVERDSSYYKAMAKRRRHRIGGFNNTQFAKEMSQKAAKARKANRVLRKKQLLLDQEAGKE